MDPNQPPDLSPVIFTSRSNGKLVIVTLNNPKKLNCLSDEMFSILYTEIPKISKSPEIKVVMLKG